MSTYYRTSEEQDDAFEAERNREFPQCDVCDGRIGMDCECSEEELEAAFQARVARTCPPLVRVEVQS